MCSAASAVANPGSPSDALCNLKPACESDWQQLHCRCCFLAHRLFGCTVSSVSTQTLLCPYLPDSNTFLAQAGASLQSEVLLNPAPPYYEAIALAHGYARLKVSKTHFTLEVRRGHKQLRHASGFGLDIARTAVGLGARSGWPCSLMQCTMHQAGLQVLRRAAWHVIKHQPAHLDTKSCQVGSLSLYVPRC